MIAQRALAFALVFSAGLLAQSTRDVSYGGAPLAPMNTGPTFDHKYLAVWDKDFINVYAPDGSLAFRYAGYAVSIAVDADGFAAVAAPHRVPDRDSGIGLLDPTGHPAAFISTGKYVPTQVCFAPDHSIWTVGLEEYPNGSEPPDYMVFRHYSRAGEELGAFLPRSSFSQIRRVHPALYAIGGWALRAANGRLGAILNLGGIDEILWIEVAFDGKELGRWPLPRTVGGRPVAFTASGAVLASTPTGIARLDRSSGKWLPVNSPSDGILIGADGDDLVFWQKAAGSLSYVPSARLE